LDAKPELQTARLRLRRWIEADPEPFAALNADPAVMEYFPDLLTREQSDSLITAIESGFEQRGFGLWAVEVRATGAFIGFTGLNEPSLEAHFTPAVEVGWRLARAAWGEGYATEAARASLAFGFEEVGLDQIVSFTSAENMRSRAVMERIGMTRSPDDDFEHPGLPITHPLRRHVLYRIGRAAAAEDAKEREGQRGLR
jgi:RimJ/RimL family protein N-acetyltransferase